MIRKMISSNFFWIFLINNVQLVRIKSNEIISWIKSYWSRMKFFYFFYFSFNFFKCRLKYHTKTAACLWYQRCHSATWTGYYRDQLTDTNTFAPTLCTQTAASTTKLKLKSESVRVSSTFFLVFACFVLLNLLKLKQKQVWVSFQRPTTRSWLSVPVTTSRTSLTRRWGSRKR